MDRPDDRAEGDASEFAQLDEYLADDSDELDDVERAELHRELEASIEEVDAGQTMDLAKFLIELRQRM